MYIYVYIYVLYMYRIAGKFGGAKVWRIYSYKVLARNSLAN